jgi:hypothetical protein
VRSTRGVRATSGVRASTGIADPATSVISWDGHDHFAAARTDGRSCPVAGAVITVRVVIAGSLHAARPGLAGVRGVVVACGLDRVVVVACGRVVAATGLAITSIVAVRAVVVATGFDVAATGATCTRGGRCLLIVSSSLGVASGLTVVCVLTVRAIVVAAGRVLVAVVVATVVCVVTVAAIATVAAVAITVVPVVAVVVAVGHRLGTVGGSRHGGVGARYEKGDSREECQDHEESHESAVADLFLFNTEQQSCVDRTPIHLSSRIAVVDPWGIRPGMPAFL